jgi:Pvc16 N-terminal domain
MIDKALSFIADELSVFLGARFENRGPHAVLSSLVNQDGSVPLGIENKLVLSLANIERDTTAVSPNRALHLNLYFLVSANFAAANYPESLQFLSVALDFFFERPVFAAPGLPSEIESLSVEMANLTIQDLKNLWSTLGNKYLPSALYKLRMVTTL